MKGLSVFENVVYREGAGKDGMLDLYLPDSEACRALLIYFHGGGLETGDKEDERGVYEELAQRGLAVVSANYRMYPSAKFPEYVEDAAGAVAFSFRYVKEKITYGHVLVGGISAGAYLSMMLHFQPDFLREKGVEERLIDGYIFDAGQPTVHYNILRERGEDTRAVRIDEAAPLYYLDGSHKANTRQKFLFLISDNDIPGRREQNELLIRTMEEYQYGREQIDYRIMRGYSHVGYENVRDERGCPYAELLYDYIGGAFPEK